MKDLKTVGERLKAEREKNGFMSQCSLAFRLDVSVTTVSGWESNEHPIPSDKLPKMQPLGLDLIYILGINPFARRDALFLAREGTLRISRHSAFAFFLRAISRGDGFDAKQWIDNKLFNQITQAEAAWWLRGWLEIKRDADWDMLIAAVNHAFKVTMEQENDK